jgi:pre-mRNA-processing factor 17
VQEASTTWHGAQGTDWQGRSWLTVPKGGPKHAPDTCFIPKRWIHTWGADGNGHAKGVNAIRFFPKSGHLLLSAGLDSKVKMWDVNGSGKCMRTYMGHTAGVRAVTFNHDGTRFISTAYDKKMCLWDTETGKVSPEVVHCLQLLFVPCQQLHGF